MRIVFIQETNLSKYSILTEMEYVNLKCAYPDSTIDLINCEKNSKEYDVIIIDYRLFVSQDVLNYQDLFLIIKIAVNADNAYIVNYDCANSIEQVISRIKHHMEISKSMADNKQKYTANEVITIIFNEIFYHLTGNDIFNEFDTKTKLSVCNLLNSILKNIVSRLEDNV